MSNFDTAHKMRIQAQISWRIEPGEEPGRLVAICDELDLVTGGGSHEEVCSMIQESMELLIEELVEEGDLEEYLQHKGVKYSKTENAKAPGFNILPYVWSDQTQAKNDDRQQIVA